jgi:hypothetical protein
MTPEPKKVSIENDFSIDFMSQGIVTITSLSNRPIEEFDKVLITVAQSFGNTDMDTFSMRGRKWVHDVGRSPTVLRFPKIKISIKVSDSVSKNIYACAYTPDGKARLLQVLKTSKSHGETIATLDATNIAAPWFLLGTGITDMCSSGANLPDISNNW